MRPSIALQGSALGVLRLDWLAPAVLTVFALLVYLNGAFFSSVSSLHVDLSINLTAAHAIREGQNPYGETALRERAEELNSPTKYIYESLFTSYIQPPTSALAVVPLTLLSWREATRAYLVLNHLLLAAAVALTLYTVRPTVPLRWAIAGAAVVVAGFSQIYGSFALGQVDATQAFLLAVGLWGYSRDKPAVTGAAIAAGVAIKLIPGVLLVYFLWKREYRFVAWVVGAGAALFLLTLPAVGLDTYRTYFTEIVPALAKGSTNYANISIGGAYNRLVIDELGVYGPIWALEEVPFNLAGRLLTAATVSAVALLALAVVGRHPLRSLSGDEGPEQPYVLEYYLFVAAGFLFSSVTWEFYAVWLLPLFLAVFLAPGRVLPADPTLRRVLLSAFILAYLGLNYPGDLYLFDVNSFFYHPEWVPGVWAEDRLQLYHSHLTVVPIVRLASLSFLVTVLLVIAYDWRMSVKHPDYDD